MKTCDGCLCQTTSRYLMPNGQYLCDPCSDALVAMEKGLTKIAVQRRYGSVKTWAYLRCFSPATVTQVLNKSRGYTETNPKKMPLSKLDILIALHNDGFEAELLADKIVR